ncbi:exosortase-associated protein EpsI, V-type [Erythrobacter sp.]|uniref:exosortase-associated protein EpsI, V-type n=1 Tax=Erythrobacter sp. TaxID=1042 RepID=UPI0025D653E9|nr:exosortase-associated protein EpsI, V-type [Erythrobacter sp.]
MPETSPSVGVEQTLVSRRSLLIGAALAAASGVAFARQPVPTHPVIEKEAFRSWIPKEIGPWRMDTASGIVLPPQDALSDRLYDNLVTRTYVSAEQPAVMLLLAYNNIQDGVLQVHRPEICYPVGGFALSNSRQDDIVMGKKPVPANFFTATGSGRVEQVGYFTRVGNSFPRTWGDQRLSVIKANLAQEVPDAMMMRVSVLALDQGQAQSVLSDFCNQFYLNSDVMLQRLLLGPNT